MNYRHAYHAGNFADVFKHVVLIALLEKLLQKDAAFCYLDTHAGSGQYDLLAGAAQKSQEFTNGILKLLEQPDAPALIQKYLACVRALNPPNVLRFYPGSPTIAKQFCRPQDKLILCELHQEEWQVLKSTFAHDKQVAVHHHDGYLGVKAFLPPKERRGLVLIDPPYEKTDEFSQLTAALATALTRFETGIYAIWYPIKSTRTTEKFLQSLQRITDRPILNAELMLYPDNKGTALNGSGMAIINPPWQLDETLNETLPWLWRALSPQGQGFYRIDG